MKKFELWKVWKRKPMLFLLRSEEGIAFDSISANRAGFVIVGGEY
jgi:hypothetical protein